MLSRWENPTRAIPPGIPPRTDPTNQAKPYKYSVPPLILIRRPYVARVAALEFKSGSEEALSRWENPMRAIHPGGSRIESKEKKKDTRTQ